MPNQLGHSIFLQQNCLNREYLSSGKFSERVLAEFIDPLTGVEASLKVLSSEMVPAKIRLIR
jgi:hypothetical protein